MLAHNPKDWFTLFEVINHPWLSQKELSNTDLINLLCLDGEFEVDWTSLSNRDENFEDLSSPDVILNSSSNDSVSSVLSDEEVKLNAESPPNPKELEIKSEDYK